MKDAMKTGMTVVEHQAIQKKEAVSFWEADFGDYVPNPQLNSDLDVDVVIIGGGFTGLTVAREFLKETPTAKVVVLEGKYVGFGASGRNGGFNMSLFGLEPEITVLRWGRERAQVAHDCMVQAVDYVRQLIAENQIECDYEHSGMLRVAYTAAQARRLRATFTLLNSFDKSGERYQYLEKSPLENRVGSDKFQAAILESDTGILNPAKHVHALKTLAEQAGARIYEHSPVSTVERRSNQIILNVGNCRVRCEKLVIAVNAWSAQIKGLPRIRSRQTPVWTAQVVTEPLSEKMWDAIGWTGRESIEDIRQMVHYFRRTACGRISIGGGNVARPTDRPMAHLDCKDIWHTLENRLKWIFPVLQNVRFDYRWGGPVSVNLDMTPEIGHIGDQRIVYACGFIGHGVSLSQLSGHLIADLLCEKKSDLTDFWMVNRKAVPWPPEPIGFAGFHAIKSALRIWDRVEERNIPKGL